MKELMLKPGMLLGVSSSATQIDGGELGHTWNRWYEDGRVRGGADPAIAAGHWDKWREDIMLMHSLGIKTYRFSVEWARIEPREGEFDEAAISHIKEELMLLIALGIKPLITLHHFTNPMWFERQGGWENPENIACFIRYVEKLVSSVGHLAQEYITINEPNLYAVNSYYYGIWPPGKHRARTMFSVMSNMAEAHIKAYRLIHDLRRSLGFRDTKVSFTLHLRVFEPKSRLNPADAASCAMVEGFFQEHIAAAMITGEFKGPLKSSGNVRKKIYSDFHAVSYSTRSTVSGFREGVRAECNKSDLGREILPSGIVKCCRFMQSITPLPIYVTASGVCDNEDVFRCKYIFDHLQTLCSSDLDVRRYYYWGFLDGFEWLDGTTARFGLVRTDFTDLTRSVKKSGRFYSEIIKNRAVTEEMYGEYVAPEQYHG